jgi:NTE family protein
MMTTKKRISLVIGSGGIKCAAAIGLWKVLQAEDIQIDSIVGCSGGSLYVTMIAMDQPIEVMQTLSETLWTSDIMQGYTESLKASKDGSLRFTERSGLVDDSVMNAKLQDIYGGHNFESLNIPAKLVATDMLSGAKVVLSEGDLFEAVRASLAIPIIFPPWEVDGRLLIDGAASDPLPVDVAIQDGADIILAMGFPLGFRKRFRSITAVQEQLNSIYTNNLLNATFAFYNLAHHAEIFPIFPEIDGAVSLFDVHRIPEMIQSGEEAMRAQLPHLNRLMENLH